MRPSTVTSGYSRVVTSGGALVFVTSLGYFLYRYAVDFAQPPVGAANGSALVWNAGLFALFALHHSLFARTPLRSWLARSAPPPLERSIYVWVASLLFMVVCAFWRPMAGVAWEVEGGLRWVLWGLQAAGVLLTLLGAAVLDMRELAGLTPPDTTGPDGRRDVVTVFKTRGPYGWVRHPIYTGWFLMLLPATPMTATRLTFALVSCAYLILAIPLEEATLRASSSGAYDAYAKKVRWRIVPGLY